MGVRSPLKLYPSRHKDKNTHLHRHRRYLQEKTSKARAEASALAEAAVRAAVQKEAVRIAAEAIHNATLAGEAPPRGNEPLYRSTKPLTKPVAPKFLTELPHTEPESDEALKNAMADLIQEALGSGADDMPDLTMERRKLRMENAAARKGVDLYANRGGTENQEPSGPSEAFLRTFGGPDAKVCMCV